MSLKKVAKGHEKLLSVSDATLAKSLLNVVDNHSSDFSVTIRLFQEIISQGAGCDLWNVLVFTYCSHFLFAQTAKSDAVFQGDHRALLSSELPLVLLLQHQVWQKLFGQLSSRGFVAEVCVSCLGIEAAVGASPDICHLIVTDSFRPFGFL